MSKDREHAARKQAKRAEAAADAISAEAAERVDAVQGARDSHAGSNLGWLLLGAGLGALSAFLLDPDRGRRRQALLRDQVVHAGTTVQKEVPRKIKHAQNRIQGLQHNLGIDLGKGKTLAEIDADPTSPEWEMAHNDDGSLTGPSY